MNAMIPLLPLPQTTKLVIALLAIAAPAFWALPLTLRRTRVARALAAVAVALPVIGLLLWAESPFPGLGVRITWSSLVVLLPLALSLWPCMLLVRLSLLRRKSPSPPAANPVPEGALLSRRTLLQGSAMALPVGAVSAGAAGLTGSSEPQRIPIIQMRYPDLHPDLVGLKILQLSDLHLGVSMHTIDLERLLLRASALKPDLIVFTGDVADDLDELEKALTLVHRFRPRLGVYACLGNHEYLHDIDATLPIYLASPVSLLVDAGVTLQVGAATLYLAGVDDPIYEGRPSTFFAQAVKRCAEGADPEAFKLLLCHRPEGFVPAAAEGFDLTLSGHTHGGQLGLFGRSVFERVVPTHFPWGPYQRGKSRLYTTSGFGHWFPFRLGCPTEAPLIVLSR